MINLQCNYYFSNNPSKIRIKFIKTENDVLNNFVTQTNSFPGRKEKENLFCVSILSSLYSAGERKASTKSPPHLTQFCDVAYSLLSFCGSSFVYGGSLPGK